MGDKLGAQSGHSFVALAGTRPAPLAPAKLEGHVGHRPGVEQGGVGGLEHPYLHTGDRRHGHLARDVRRRRHQGVGTDLEPGLGGGLRQFGMDLFHPFDGQLDAVAPARLAQAHDVGGGDPAGMPERGAGVISPRRPAHEQRERAHLDGVRVGAGHGVEVRIGHA